MNLELHRKHLLNPPLKIFNQDDEGSKTSDNKPAGFFRRPQLQRFVNHDRVARHLIKKRFSITSPLD